jgi:hypothetical protein
MNTTCLANGQRQTAIINYEISTMWETKPRAIPQRNYRILIEQNKWVCKVYADAEESNPIKYIYTKERKTY